MVTGIMESEYKAISIRIFALAGVLAISLVIVGAILWVTMGPDESAGIAAPLERIPGKEKYFGYIDDSPLAKSDMINVARVKVISETPNSAILEILYDSKDDAPLDDVWISASILKDTGLKAMHFNRPAKAIPGLGKKAIVSLGIPDEARFEILASNIITVNFYKGGHMPFHEAKYEYQRIWCRKITDINDLWKQPYPPEKGSKYSMNGTRSVSRLCLGDVEQS